MRHALIFALALSTPALAAPPLCALPAAPVFAAAETRPPSPAAGDPYATQPGLPDGAGPSASVPATLAGTAFVQHVAASGSRILDFGLSHGLHAFAARSGAAFMLFQMTADGQAAVSGAVSEISPEQLRTVAAGNVTDLGRYHGLPALFVRSGGQFQVFYVTPDGAAVIPGVMWDAAGKNLTRAQVADVPGAVPTVVAGSPGDRGAAPAAPGAALALVQKAFSGTVGPATAPHLWMAIDPQCIYSVRAYQMLQPYVDKGRLQLTVVPLSVLDYEDHGQSTRSALALLSKPSACSAGPNDSNCLVKAWQAGNVNGPPSADADARLKANHAIQQAIGLRATPTFFWRKPDGTEGRLEGLPPGIEALLSSVAS